MIENTNTIESLDTLSNNSLIFELKQCEADYENIKLKIIKDYDKMVEIEKRVSQVVTILQKRLKK